MLKLCNENNSKLSIGLIKQFHYTLTKNCFTEKLLLEGERPGEFRKRDYALGLHNTGAYALNIEGNLNLLVNVINDVTINENNALRTASYFHCSFQKILPLADGNEIVVRMLTNYLLISNNLAPIIIFYDDKEDYYLALEYFKSMGKIDRMVTFLDDQSYKTWLKNYNVKFHVPKCLFNALYSIINFLLTLFYFLKTLLFYSNNFLQQKNHLIYLLLCSRQIKFYDCKPLSNTLPFLYPCLFPLTSYFFEFSKKII